MKYLFDCTFIWPDIRYKSIPTYAFRLLQALPDVVVADCSVLIRSSMVNFFEELKPQLNLVVVKYNSIIAKIPKVGYRYNNWLFRRCIRSLNYDCILIMDEQRLCNLFHTNKRKVAILHDLKGIKSTKNEKINYNYYGKLIKSCDSLIAISEYTKQDILKYYHVDDQMVNVVYNSVSLPKVSSKPPTFVFDRNYILFVNTLQPYKNALTLVKAFNRIKARFDLNLVFVGTSTAYWENEVLKYARDNGFKDRIIRLENISDKELKYLYENATLFVTTSKHEGFGYTPIEAAMCKCPVISSTCEALPETTRGMLHYYEPVHDADALMEKLIEVLDNPPTHEHLEQIASTFSSLYKSETQVAEILKIMRTNC